ncbi:MAG TPA: PRC-barrel domain-containing protein [Balneolaceae bacterium]|nr:PRC-barrel domain-containing protein [Balneolaceae bacterium]
MDNSNQKRLYNLDEIDFEAKGGNPDVRGWQVKGVSGNKIGRVDRVLVERDSKKVVYLDIDVDDALVEEGFNLGIDNDINNEDDDHLLIPFGLVHLNNDEQSVQANDIDFKTFAQIKRFASGETIDSDYERYLVGHYSQDYDWNYYTNNFKWDETSYDDFYYRPEFELKGDRPDEDNVDPG